MDHLHGQTYPHNRPYVQERAYQHEHAIQHQQQQAFQREQAFQHEQYAYGMEPNQQQTIFMHQHMPQPTHLSQATFQQPVMPVHPELMYTTHGYSEVPSSWLYECEDANEHTTRPRLTKKQVNTLEGMFQTNKKPNSIIKRELAQLTELTLPRVANWFQNRRAKEKQIRKLEEFENAQQQKGSQSEPGFASEDEDEDDEEEIVPVKQENISDHRSQKTNTNTNELKARSSASTLKTSPKRSPTRIRWEEIDRQKREASQASLNRALAAAARGPDHPFQPVSAHEYMASGQPRRPSMPTINSCAELEAQPQPVQQHLSHFWPQQGTDQLWQAAIEPTISVANDIPFDFDFDSSITQTQHEGTDTTSPTNSSSQGYAVSPANGWEQSLITPTMPPLLQHEFQQPLLSPGLPVPTYSESRRPSLADSLTNNFDSIALVSQSPQTTFNLSSSVSPDTSEGGIDLASRRRRPRPAPLTSVGTRSRSYGTGSAASPTLRQGMTPQTAQTLRQVKSTGYGLNNHYAGIRKSSLPQRSPLNVSTFAESQALAQLLAQQNNAQLTSSQQFTPMNSTTPLSHLPSQEQSMGSMSQIQQNNMNMQEISQRYRLHSPPVTPFQQNFIPPSSSMMPPSITQTQYASIADYTPPYSAGPLTNSSWSDAPLASPDFVNFPPSLSIPPLNPYGGQQEDTSFNPWMFSSSSDVSPRPIITTPREEQKKTEFYYHDFPNMKEDLAQAAQQLNRQKPRQYASTIAFEHTKPEDFVRN